MRRSAAPRGAKEVVFGIGHSVRSLLLMYDMNLRYTNTAFQHMDTHLRAMRRARKALDGTISRKWPAGLLPTLCAQLRGTPMIAADQYVGSRARYRPGSTGTAIPTHAPCA